MRSFVLIIFMTLLLFGCHSHSDWEVALRTNRSGKVLTGSKEKLINAIRAGSEVRIGWGSQGKTTRIEHLSEPIWLAIMNEKEVMAHLDPQYLSVVDWNSLSATYNTPERLRNEWRVVINTNGVFDAVIYDRKLDTVIRRMPQRHPMTWFIKTSSDRMNPPLYSAIQDQK